MFFSTILLHYLEQYEGKSRVGTHADFKAFLKNSTKVYNVPSYDLSTIFYTVLLMLRVALVLVAVYEASRDQSKKRKPNFWIVFLAFWFPEIYLVIHLATGWHKKDIFCSHRK